jgi:hypothetical protein
MPILKTIFDICLLRGRPQDLPASWNLLQLTALATVATGYARAARVDGPGLWGLLLVIFQTAIFGAVVWMILQVRARPERWLQSILALYAVNALFNLMILPILPQLVEAGKLALAAIQQGSAMPIGWELIFASAADIWYLMVMAQVMRHATDLPFGLSALISFFALISVFVLEMLFISVFSLPVPT